MKKIKFTDAELTPMFKSVLDQDRAPIVICDLTHTIVYMNRSAVKHYERYGGESLLGRSLMDCHAKASRELIEKVITWFGESVDNNMIFTYRSEKENKDVYMVALRDGEEQLIGYYEKHEYRNAERYADSGGRTSTTMQVR